jgi:hypothetical protein
VFAFDTP